MAYVGSNAICPAAILCGSGSGSGRPVAFLLGRLFFELALLVLMSVHARPVHSTGLGAGLGLGPTHYSSSFKLTLIHDNFQFLILIYK